MILSFLVSDEQQQELDDSYRRAAAVKLKTAMGGRAGLVLAHALERWRWACALLPAEQQSANGEVAERAAAALYREIVLQNNE